MRFELFVRGKRIAALEARIGHLERRVQEILRLMDLACREAGLPALEDKPEKPPLRIVQ